MRRTRRGALALLSATVLLALATALLGADSLWVAGTVLGGVALLGIWLAWRAEDRDDRLGDLGRALLVGALLAVAVGAVQSEIDRREKERDERDTFRLTLALQKDLSGVDLAGKDMSGLSLAGKVLAQADLVGARLAGANLFRADLRQSDLAGADLDGARLVQATLIDAQLRDASLRDVVATNADLRVARLEDADLAGAHLVGADLAGACLAGASLRGADLTGADLRDAVLTGADLRGARLEYDLRPARLDGAGLAGARLDAATRPPAGFPLRDASAGEGSGAPPTPRPPAEARRDRVARVLDGDTVVLGRGGPARLIGIDAPAPGQRAGGRARGFATRALAGRSVRYAVGARPRDRFGRNLVYLWRDGELFNQRLLDAGLATPLLIAPNLRYRDRLEAAARAARQRGLGVWRHCPDDGDA